MKDCASLVVWIQENTDLKEHDAAEKAAIWWVCCESASATLDSGMKDVARMFLDGVKPMDSTDVDQEVTICLELDIDEGDRGHGLQEALIANLRTHFGI